MKKNQISLGFKVLIAIIIFSMITITTYGIKNIFAEPSIEDLVNYEEVGTYSPSSLYDDTNDGVELIAWLNTTQVMVDYDVWNDSDGNGNVGLEDVYARENYQQDVRMENVMYPIFRPISGKDDHGNNIYKDYYVVSLPDIELYNGALQKVQLANANDLAEMKDPSTYWFDRENSVLYVDESLIDLESEDESLATPFRLETIMLFKDIEKVTKVLSIATLFEESIDDTHGLYANTPNEDVAMDVNKWLLSGLQYQLVKPEQLAYAKSNNLEVFLNGSPYNNWEYDETSGRITIECSPFNTRHVAVKFNAVEDSTSAEQMLQEMQGAGKQNTAQALSLEDAITGDSVFLKELDYSGTEPQIGTFQELDFTALLMLDKNGQLSSINAVQGGMYIPISIIRDAVNEALSNGSLQWVNGRIKTTTMSAFQSEPGVGQNKEMQDWLNANQGGDPNNNKYYIWGYGHVVWNLYQAAYEKNMNALNNAVYISEQFLLQNKHDSTNGKLDWNKALTNLWIIGNDNATYLSGTTNTSFLGGTVTNGHAFFDLTCAQINAPNALAYASMNGGQYKGSDYRTNATIIGKNATHIYVCIWSRSLNSEVGSARHHQRLLGYARIPYKADKMGSFLFSKQDVNNGQLLEGSVYELWTKDGSFVKTITSQLYPVSSGDLPAGTYVLKEIVPSLGYLIEKNNYEFEIKGGETQNIVLKASPQQADYKIQVYDITTKDNSVKVPVVGATFEIYDNNHTLVGTKTTDGNGVIGGFLPATGNYTFKQTSTAVNYRIETDPNSPNCCQNIIVHGEPNKNGTDIVTRHTHFEERQTFDVLSHVQDEQLRVATPSYLGGTSSGGSLTQTVGAKYQLINTTEILLGYTNNGIRVSAPAGTVLEIETRNTDGADIRSNYATACDGGDGKAYIVANAIYYNGTRYAIPNGEYKWKMIEASPGYYNNNAENIIDAKWTLENVQTKYLTLTTPVIQSRQKAEITIFNKAYSLDMRNDGGSLNHNGLQKYKDNIYSALKPLTSVNGTESGYKKYVNTEYTKSVYTQNDINAISTEGAIVYKNGTPLFNVLANHSVQNSIFALYNLDTIVDIKNGQEIEAGTLLGVYKTNSNGQIIISQIGSKGFSNPNKESVGMTSGFGDIAPMTTGNELAVGALPNGIYGVYMILPADGQHQEYGLVEEVINDTIWKNNNNETQRTTCITFTYEQRKEDDIVDVPFAPDVPIDSANPYDPYHPLNPGESPDDSDRIGFIGTNFAATTKWINDNHVSYAYRIVDPMSVGNDSLYDVQDMLPTTFAFYIKNKLNIDPTYNYDYKLSYYYEVTEAEYNAAPEELKNDGTYKVINEAEKQYAKKFETRNANAEDYLYNIITLNRQSPGYENYERLLEHDKPIAGAITNVDWLNKKISSQADGDFNIYVVANISVTYYSKVTNEMIVIDHLQSVTGNVIIKNRNLLNLD